MSGPESEPVGTLAEEAAKLFAAVSETFGSDGHARPDDATSKGCSAECRWCPICQLLRAARATSPEVREHLGGAAMSLAMALKSFLEESAPTRESAPFEKIDLRED